MVNEDGLRERKKRRTRQVIAQTAIRLFLETGYDQTSITQIAAAAEVARRTVLTYFPTKEALVLDRFADHRGESARVVRENWPRRSPLEALHTHFRDGLSRRDPVTGLSDDPTVLAVYALVRDTPVLATGLLRQHAADTELLAEALEEILTRRHWLTARLAASQITATQRTLADHNSTQLNTGATIDQLHRKALRAADRGFALLSGGLDTLFPVDDRTRSGQPRTS